MSELVNRVATTVRGTIPPPACRALVLIGGYGRGEGGVLRTGTTEAPHNNLDFVLVTASDRPPVDLQRVLDAQLQLLCSNLGIRIDLSVVSAAQLRRARPLVIWCDMKQGHKTVLGDPDFVPSLRQLQPERIPTSDVRNLLVNRGTLLLINQLLLDHGRSSEEDRKFMIRHIFKATIGYGDAFLFQFGDYSGSYLKKQQRMRQRKEVPEAFRRLYDEALEFRFEPHYEPYLDRNLIDWTDSLRAELAPLHLRWESWALRTPLAGWEDYGLAAWRLVFLEEPWSLRSWARKAGALMRGPPWPSAGSWSQRAAVRCAGHAGALSLLYPAPAYGLPPSTLTDLARHALAARSGNANDLRIAYLQRWGTHVDTNFFALLQQLGIRLESSTTL